MAHRGNGSLTLAVWLIFTAAPLCSSAIDFGAADEGAAARRVAQATTFLNVKITPEGAKRRVLAAVQAAQGDPALRGRYRQAVAFGTGLFPSDDELKAFELPEKGEGRPSALAHWLTLPAEARRFDLWLSPDVDFYWRSDHIYKGRPADFSAQFIGHFGDRGAGGTTVEVVQFRSRVRLGKKFDLLGRTGPGRYWDVRPVAPSPRANEELLAFLFRALDTPRE